MIHKDLELTLLRREKIGIVFQLFNLLENLMVSENIALPLVLARKTSGYIKREMEEQKKRGDLSFRLGYQSAGKEYSA